MTNTVHSVGTFSIANAEPPRPRLSCYRTTPIASPYWQQCATLSLNGVSPRLRTLRRGVEMVKRARPCSDRCKPRPGVRASLTLSGDVADVIKRSVALREQCAGPRTGTYGA